MKVLMFHDIRDNAIYFKDRYKLPYFISTLKFESIFKKHNSSFSILSNDININFSNENDYLYTFDDGLKDHLHVAKYLAKKNTKAVFFVPTKIFEDDFIIDSHKIQFLLASVNNIELKSIILNEVPNSEDVLFKYGVSNWANNIWTEEMIFITRFFREYPDSIFRKNILTNLFNQFVPNSVEEIREDFYLNENDLKTIFDLGHIIGGHGHESLNLIHENSETKKQEIITSSKFLDQLEVPTKLFAYPNGCYDQFSIDLLKKNNFDYCFSTSFTDSNIEKTNFTVNRLDGTTLI
jgi:peptidoglycan/xylan/chitin deacetylase (PgdA/CDA1 family)